MLFFFPPLESCMALRNKKGHRQNQLFQSWELWAGNGSEKKQTCSQATGREDKPTSAPPGWLSKGQRPEAQNGSKGAEQRRRREGLRMD